MKAWAIALKDIKRAFQSPFGVLNLLVLPLAITGIVHLAFGGIDDSVSLPATHVIVVNQDEAQYGFSAGQLLTELLSDERLADLLIVSPMDDPAAARLAVDEQEAGVALLIPADLSRAVTLSGVETRIVIYSDPTLTLGPGIVRELVTGLIDSMTGATILNEVVVGQIEAQGATMTEEGMRTLIAEYTAQIAPIAGEENARPTLLMIEAPPSNPDAAQGADLTLASVMVGMMVYYAFFTGANSAESILREEEELTLQRLFTTPTSAASIYLGKLLYIVIMVLGQAIVLHVASSLFFGIHWPSLGWSAALVIGLVIASAGFALFWMSLAKTRQQTGAIIGGVFTVAGMLGGCFTVAVPNMPAALNTVALILPTAGPCAAGRPCCTPSLAPPSFCPWVCCWPWGSSTLPSEPCGSASGSPKGVR